MVLHWIASDRTDDDDVGSSRRNKTIDRLHEQDDYMDCMEDGQDVCI